MPPPKSKAWGYFDKTMDGGKCQLCTKHVMSKGGNTTNLASHLRRAHNIECSPHPSVAGLLKKVAPAKPVTGKARTTETPALPDLPAIDLPAIDLDPSPSTSTDQCDQVKGNTTGFQKINTGPAVQSTTPSTVSIWDRARMGKLDQAKQHRITRMMAAYMVKDMRPYSTVESEHFREMIKAIDDRVVIPNSETFSTRIIPAWYHLEAAKLLEELGNSSHVALTSDCWTSRTTIPYMTVTAHYIDEHFDLQSKVLQTKVLDERHTGENMSSELNKVLQSWKIDEKVSAITTDNASNIKLAVQLSDISLQIGCLAHTLDLAAKKAVEVAKPLTKRMKPVISFLHRSHVGAKVLKEKQEALGVLKHKLLTDVETRWNSTYLMFERYFEQRVAVHATFMDKRLDNHKSVYRDFKDSEVVKAEEFLETMRPLYEITVAVCSEKSPTASLILPLVDKLLKRCEAQDGDSDFSSQLKKVMKENLSKRYQDEKVRDFLMKCTAMDPRMKMKSIINEATWGALAAEIVELLELEEIARTAQAQVTVKKEEGESATAPPPEKKAKTLIENFLCDDDDDDEVTVTAMYQRSLQEMAEDELKAYRSLPKHSDPLLFHKANRHRLPHVYQLALKYLITQATSVASERVFSTSGDILSSERSCIDADALDGMIFLKKNAKTLEFLG